MAVKNETKERIAHRIKAARRFRGWSVTEFAVRTGISEHQIKRYESSGNVPCDELEILALTLRLTITHFLEQCVLCCDK